MQMSDLHFHNSAEGIMLVPEPWEGVATDSTISNWKGVEWLHELGSNTWCHLWLRWPISTPQNLKISLPQGYNLYVVSFHLEAVDMEWLWKQAETIDAPIIVLTESDGYNCPLPENVTLYKFFSWHWQFELIKKWHPKPVSKQISHQFSAICNRITQSKLLVTTALLELNTTSIIKLSTWQGDDALSEYNNKQLSQLRNTFYNKWYGKTIDLPDTHTTFKNHQYYTSNPWTDVYQKCALHFTNESFHYSYMQNDFGNYIYPGPFITEKTLKCLVGGTGMIPVGQFETYKALETVGFEFNYGFNTDFDSDKGNISRLVSLINLITELSAWSIEDLFEATKESSNHNQDHIYSNKLLDICNADNLNTINTILDKYR